MNNRMRIAAYVGLIGVVAAVAVFSSAQPVLAGGAGPDDDVKALTKLDIEWSKAAESRDVAKLAAFYAADAIAYPPNEKIAVGREAAKKVWATYMSEPTFSISWTMDRVEVAKSGELAYTAGSYRDSYKGADGKQVNETGKYVCIWKKQGDGTWKAFQDIWNSDAK